MKPRLLPLASRPSRSPLSWTAASLAVVLALALAGCKPRGAGGATPPPPQVTVAPVEQRDIIEWDEFTGRTEAVERVEVRPRVSGHIQEVRFQSGQLVKKGEVLFVIDPRWHQAEFQRRQAEYDQAAVRAENAEREAARTGILLERKAISTEEGEQRQSRYREAAAGLLAAEAAWDSAKLDLEFTEIRAPIDGRVSRALVTAGNYVSGTAGSATVLTTLVSVDPVYVYVDVDENSLLKFNRRRRESDAVCDSAVPVELQLADEQGFPHLGRIESFDNRLDAQSGSIVLRAVFPNSDGRIVPGLFARLRLPGGAKAPALLVEETAIGTDQAQKFVLALTSTNTAAYRPVKLGAVIDGKRIIREGVRAGEKIVINGLARVRPGMPVAPMEGVHNGDPKVASR